jgi:hypothetical protein
MGECRQRSGPPVCSSPSGHAPVSLSPSSRGSPQTTPRPTFASSSLYPIVATAPARAFDTASTDEGRRRRLQRAVKFCICSARTHACTGLQRLRDERLGGTVAAQHTIPLQKPSSQVEKRKELLKLTAAWLAYVLANPCTAGQEPETNHTTS